MLSGANVFEISDIQEVGGEVALTRKPQCNNVLLKGMSREKCSPSAQCRSFFLGIQPIRLNVHSYFRECSSSAPRSYFVSACEAEKRCSPVVPFLLPWRHHSFLETNKPDGYPLDEWQRMVLSETRGLWLSSICPRGHRVTSET